MNIKKILILIFTIHIWSLPGFSQSRIVKDFKPVCDSLSIMLQEKTTVKNNLRMKAVMKRGSEIDIYFTHSLSDIPWQEDSYLWFKKTLKDLFPEGYRQYRLGRIFCDGLTMDKLITEKLGFDGLPTNTPYRINDRRDENAPLVENPDKEYFHKGLSGRHIAVWQSHGRFYDQNSGRWKWQRPCLFQTVEDMLTPGFVLQFLVPMIENAGGYVILPRERDTGRKEIITDNDPHFEPDTVSNPDIRRFGQYSESGKWKSERNGFADFSAAYYSEQNPFASGTARSAECIANAKNTSRLCTARWTPEIPERGEYAVYVSYKTLPESTESAHYTVHHLGGESHFYVNQRMGGSTWVYLGSFEFAKGASGYVSLDNVTPSGRKHKNGSIVSADAVKIGGGTGNIARHPASDQSYEPETSGMPRFAEGARYWMQWSGISPEVYSQNEQKNDYRDDFMSRGKWVQELSGGSKANPKGKGRNIPVDMAFAFHSDAGFSPDDSIIGTLGIYTLLCDKSNKFPDGSDRASNRELTDLVQSQIVRDVRAGFDPLWSRRHIWNRSYSESRTTGVPTMLLEMLSHQNFADMKHGLDPAFRFTVSRAVYKGMLKYLSNRYGTEYAVQPLPVNTFSARIIKEEGEFKALLSWKDTPDTLEPTAVSENYILYSRIDGNGFDNGIRIKDIHYSNGHASTKVSIEPGHIYSFKIAAANSGGISFPSEILSIGIPEEYARGGYRENEPLNERAVIVINNFNRVSGPTWFDTPLIAGFDNSTDGGVPYMKDISFIGEMYQTRRDMAYISDDNPGFGASYTGYAGKTVAGNTFDYPYIHGMAILKAGHPFFSAGSQAFVSDSTLRKEAWSADIICGKQVTTKIGRGAISDRYRIFTPEIQDALNEFTSEGGNIIVSGANIGTDIWDRVYPVECDSLFRVKSINFAQKVLGYKWITGHASKSAEVDLKPEKQTGFPCISAQTGFSFWNETNEVCYCVEAPDGLAPYSRKSKSILKYSDSGISAGIIYDSGRYKTVCIGFPLETIREPEVLEAIINSSLKFFSL